MDDTEWLAGNFETHRDHLRGVAYRMLGSLTEADDAVQETWLRLARSDTGEVQNLRAWLTTVVARVCLDMLRSRTARREDALDVHLPGPDRQRRRRAPTPRSRQFWPTRSGWRCSSSSTPSPPQSASPLCCTTSSPCRSRRSGPSWTAPPPRPSSWPAARGAGYAAPRPCRTPTSPGSARSSTPSLPRRGKATSTACSPCSIPTWCCAPTPAPGPFGPSRLVRGAQEVASQARRFARLARHARPVLVNGTPGLLVAPDGEPVSLMSVTVRGGQDRRDRHPRRPRTPPPPGSDRPEQLISPVRLHALPSAAREWPSPAPKASGAASSPSCRPGSSASRRSIHELDSLTMHGFSSRTTVPPRTRE